MTVTVIVCDMGSVRKCRARASRALEIPEGEAN